MQLLELEYLYSGSGGSGGISSSGGLGGSSGGVGGSSGGVSGGSRGACLRR